MSVSDENSQERIEVVVPLKCKCGQGGDAVWEGFKNGSQASLVSLPDNFYERIQKKDRKSIEVVCNICGAVQPGGYGSTM
jgi:hypothetical protein